MVYKEKIGSRKFNKRLEFTGFFVECPLGNLFYHFCLCSSSCNRFHHRFIKWTHFVSRLLFFVIHGIDANVIDGCLMCVVFTIEQKLTSFPSVPFIIFVYFEIVTFRPTS